MKPFSEGDPGSLEFCNKWFFTGQVGRKWVFRDAREASSIRNEGYSAGS